ncbi:MAG: TadE/TadG family type IV pilus assembly protein [Henriciella sp.]|nr:pilus assembly protein [Hyphomonadaceae bacterium]
MFNVSRKLKKSEDGISAVEFALIAPLMAIIYFGCIELSLMMTLDRKVTGATAALGDLTSRAASVNNDDLTDIFEATRMIMQPNDMTKSRMRITSLYEDSGDVKVAWSDGCNMAAYAEDQQITIPANLIPEDGTLIMSEIEYDYDSGIGYFFTTSKTLSDTFYLRPRRVDSITRDRTSGSFSCAYANP